MFRFNTKTFLSKIFFFKKHFISVFISNCLLVNRFITRFSSYVARVHIMLTRYVTSKELFSLKEKKKQFSNLFNKLVRLSDINSRRIIYNTRIDIFIENDITTEVKLQCGIRNTRLKSTLYS